MKTLFKRLEHSSSTWFVLIIVIIFILLRLPSLIEPYWYGDEGVYETIARALNHGRLLYTGIWDNKPPLLYLTYALFNGDQFSVKFLSLLSGVASIIFFFLLAKKLFIKLNSVYVATTIFALLFATPLTESDIANAENFILLPIIAAAYIIYSHHPELISESLSKADQMPKKVRRDQKSIRHSPFSIFHFFAGLLLGIAFLYKIVAIFDFIALAAFLKFSYLPMQTSLRTVFRKKTLNFLFHKLSFYALGFLLPLLITSFYFIARGTGSAFFTSVFSNNVSYVNVGNAFLIPQGLLIIKIILLALVVWWIFNIRQYMKPATLFITLWFIFEVFDSFFSQRPYMHYFLMMIPSLSLLIGLALQINYLHNQVRKIYVVLGVIAVFAVIFFLQTSYLNNFYYYPNYLRYITNNESVDTYQRFFSWNINDDYQVADYLRAHTKPNDPVFIWGNDPQIYVLSNTLPVGKYTVAYHISANASAEAETVSEIHSEKPKYVVILSDAPQLTIPISHYQILLSLGGDDIYERAY